MPGLAVAVAGLLPAAEREVRLGAGRPGVDVDDAGLEVAHRPEGRVDVAGEDRGRQAVADLVGGRHRLVVAVDRDHRQHGPEDLVLRDPGHRLDAREDRRPVEVAVREVAVGRPLAAGHQLALAAADPDVALDLVDARARSPAARRRPPRPGRRPGGGPVARVSRRAHSSSATARSTITREHAVHRWPVVPNADHRIPSTARSRSASRSTTTAFLPPSSRLTRLSSRPARSAMPRPVSDEPVNEITGTSRLSTIASPTSRAGARSRG